MHNTCLVGLDRDGTINVDPGYFGKDDDWKEQLEIYSGVTEGIKKLKSYYGVKVIVATNQAGVAMGFYGVERVKEINEYIDQLLRAQGAFLDGWYFSCFVDKKYAKIHELVDHNWVNDNTDETKPGIGMLRRAAKDLGFTLESLAVTDNLSRIYFIGDRVSDVKTGLNAKGKSVLVTDGKNNNDYKKAKDMLKEYPERIFFADNFLSATEMILSDHRYVVRTI